MKIDDNLEANLHEQTRVRGGGGGEVGALATWRRLSNAVAFEINILQINMISSLYTIQNSPHIPC